MIPFTLYCLVSLGPMLPPELVRQCPPACAVMNLTWWRLSMKDAQMHQWAAIGRGRRCMTWMVRK